MARQVGKDVRFTGARSALIAMGGFLIGVAAVIFMLSPLSPVPNDLLITSFAANPFLNGLILIVLGLGIVYNFRQASMVDPAVRWIETYRSAVDPRRADLPEAPSLIGAMPRILIGGGSAHRRMGAETARAILDSLGTRIDEGREIARYAASLLVFLGLLGTFWGLLQTVTEVSGVISSLGAGDAAEGDPGSAISALITNLNAPLSGMNTAFSSSLFGLGGSLVLGFLDIRAGRAQNRFYADVEDWLSGLTESRETDNTGAALGAAIDALRAEIRHFGHRVTERPLPSDETR